MKIVCIGAGNVATHLACKLYTHKHTIVQVYSRSIQSAEALAVQVDATATTQLSEIVTDADLYLFAVTDAILSSILAQVPPNKGLWIHTAGSMPFSVFSNYTERYGVLYPFQTCSKQRKIDWKRVPICIEAAQEDDLRLLESVANQLSSNVLKLESERRKKLHLAGVFASNFTNYMYTLAAQILQDVNLPFAIAIPLIDETSAKIHALAPLDAQTGPAIRFDENVLHEHLSLIEDPKLKEIYTLLSQSIYDTHNNQTNR